MTKQEADFIGSMNMCDEISNEAYKKIMCNFDVEEQQPCDDVLSRQTVLQCIKQSREGIDWGQSEDADAFLHYSAALYRTIASKECFPSVTPQQTRWIPVSERLPEVGEKVLCQCQANIYEVLKLTGDGWYHDKNHCYMLGFVIAWMPLPSSYQEESEDKG